MSNCYSPSAAEITLNCSEEQYLEFKQLLGNKFEPETDNFHGYECSYNEGKLFFFAEENSDVDNLPSKALKYLGGIILDNNKSYLPVGVCFYSDRIFPGSVGGYYYTIDTKGDIVFNEK